MTTQHQLLLLSTTTTMVDWRRGGAAELLLLLSLPPLLSLSVLATETATETPETRCIVSRDASC